MLGKVANAFNRPAADVLGLPWDLAPILPAPCPVETSQFVDYGTNLTDSCHCGGSCGGCGGGSSAGLQGFTMPAAFSGQWWAGVGLVAVAAYFVRGGFKK